MGQVKFGCWLTDGLACCSGFFQFHPLLRDFDFYWRMEPDVHYYCDLDYDPFLYMQVSTPISSCTSRLIRC